jgi:hypothetical protein
MGNYALLFYFSHVVTIVIVANLVFWLKDIDPRFRQGDDADFDDIPSLREHREKLIQSGQLVSLLLAFSTILTFFICLFIFFFS